MNQKKTNMKIWEAHSAETEPIKGIYIIQEGKFVYVNQQLTHLAGYTREELIGTDVCQYIHPKDIPLVQENILKRLIGEIKGIYYQYRGVRKDKSIIYFCALSSKSIYKGKPAIIGSLIEMKEQRIVEEDVQNYDIKNINKTVEMGSSVV